MIKLYEIRLMGLKFSSSSEPPFLLKDFLNAKARHTRETYPRFLSVYLSDVSIQLVWMIYPWSAIGDFQLIARDTAFLEVK